MLKLWVEIQKLIRIFRVQCNVMQKYTSKYYVINMINKFNSIYIIILI